MIEDYPPFDRKDSLSIAPFIDGLLWRIYPSYLHTMIRVLIMYCTAHPMDFKLVSLDQREMRSPGPTLGDKAAGTSRPGPLPSAGFARLAKRRGPWAAPLP